MDSSRTQKRKLLLRVKRMLGKYAMASLRRLIETHAKQEEEQEFPRLRRVLQGRDKAMVAGQIRREEALVLQAPAIFP